MVKKIMYFMDNYSTLGGAANTLLRQAVLMHKIGVEIQVVVSTYGNREVCEDYLKICKENKINICAVDFFVSNQPEYIDVISILKRYQYVKEIIQNFNPDIVHSVQLNPTVELACRELEIPHVMNIYQALPEFFVFNYPDIFPRFHICDSECYATFWERHINTHSYCIRTVAESKHERRNIRRNENLEFICVGLLCERKNQLEVIKAFEKAIQQGMSGRLRLYGHNRTEYAKECIQYIEDNALTKQIEVMGFCEDMESVYAHSDALICGSKSESYPNVVSESLANGVVVISTPVAGVPEIIQDRYNGYLCNGYDQEDILQGVMSFVSDMQNEHVEQVLEQAYATYEEVHSPKAVTNMLVNCYEEMQKEYLEKYFSEYSYGITDFKRDMCRYIELIEDKGDRFTNLDYVKGNIWKIIHISKLLIKNIPQKKIYIWGTGKFGKIYYETLNEFGPEIKITAFVDSYKQGIFMGRDIIKPHEMNVEESIVMIGVKKNDEIIEYLEGAGYKYNSNYFVFEPKRW